MMRHKVEQSDEHSKVKTPLRSLKSYVCRTAHLVVSIKWLDINFLPY